MSNFLGEVAAHVNPSSIISGSELIAREGVNLQQSMYYRPEEHSVFLVLPKGETFGDEWDPESGIYSFRGHDSLTAEGKESDDQRAMYASGKLSQNGKFLKAALAAQSGENAPITVQVYEKLEGGAFFDKGLFELIGARESKEEGRLVYHFILRPQGEPYFERMLPAIQKAAIWNASQGRCAQCGTQSALRFVPNGDSAELLCALHRGEAGGLLG